MLGVDIGGTHIRAGIIRDEQIVHAYKGDIKKQNAAQVLHSIIEAINKVISDDVKAIGVGCPGFIDHREGVVTKSPNLPLRNYPLKKYLEHEFRLPVIIENDAACFTLAQARVHEVSSLVGMVLGTGLGSALVVDGAIYHGKGFAGEIGHIPWSSSLFPTKEVESIIGARGLLHLAKLRGINVKDTKDLYDLAKTSQEAKHIFEDFGSELGKVLAIAHLLFDPELIVVGGEVARSWKYFNKPMKKALATNSPFRTPRVVVNKITHAGVVGASLLVER